MFLCRDSAETKTFTTNHLINSYRNTMIFENNSRLNSEMEKELWKIFSICDFF